MEKINYEKLIGDPLKEENGKLIFTYEVKEKKKEEQKKEKKKK